MKPNDPPQEVPPATPIARALRPLTESQQLLKREAVEAEKRVTAAIVAPGTTEVTDQDFKVLSIQLLTEMRDGLSEVHTRVELLETDKVRREERKRLIRDWSPWVAGFLTCMFAVLSFLTADKVSKFNALDEDKMIAKADIKMRQTIEEVVPPLIRKEINAPTHVNLVNPPATP